MKTLFYIINVMLISLLFTGCGESDTAPSQSTGVVLLEESFTQDDSIRATENDIVIINLESAISDTNLTDNHILGSDEIPFKFTNSITTQLVIDSNLSVEAMYIIETSTNTIIASATKENQSTTITLKANEEYLLRVEHDNLSSEMKTLFVRFDNTSLIQSSLINMQSSVSAVNTLKTTGECESCNLSGVNLSKANLSGRLIMNANFSGANLSDANLSSSNLSGTNLSLTNLSGANLTYASLDNSLITSKSDTYTCTTSGAVQVWEGYPMCQQPHQASIFCVENCSVFQETTVTRTNLSNTDLSNATLKNTDLGQADLRGVDFTNSILNGVNLSGINLSNQDFTNVLFQKANLSHVDFSGANLTGADMWLTNLSHTNLTNTNLTSAFLNDSNLTGATFVNVAMSNTMFSGAIWTDGTTICGDVADQCY